MLLLNFKLYLGGAEWPNGKALGSIARDWSLKPVLFLSAPSITGSPNITGLESKRSWGPFHHE